VVLGTAQPNHHAMRVQLNVATGRDPRHVFFWRIKYPELTQKRLSSPLLEFNSHAIISSYFHTSYASPRSASIAIMTSSFYLYNNYSTSYLSIDPATSGFGLRALTGTSDVSLPFTISPIANSNFVKICTSVASNPYCLDIYGDKKTVPHLSTPGNYMGQQWSLISSKTAGLFKLSNAYTGTGWYLDVYADGVNGALMSENDYTGQYWKQVQVRNTIAT
jgi:hypothetical protein